MDTKNSRRLHLREIAFLTVPVLLLGLYAVATRDRGPFKLVVQKTELRLVGKKGVEWWEKGRQGFEITTTLSYEGNRPDWWGDGLNPGDTTWISFNGKDEKDDFYRVGLLNGIRWDKETECYSFTLQSSMPDKPHFLDSANCHILVELETGNVPNQRVARINTIIPATSITLVEK